MIGVEGVGKSSAGAKMPKPIFLCGESGLVGPQFAETPSYTPHSWEDVLDFLDYLATEAHGYRSIVVDTVDWLEPILYAYICQRDGKSGVEDYGFGKGYVIACDEFRRFLSKLESVNKAGMSVLALTHCHVKPFQNPVGENYDRYEPKLAKQISGLLKEWADAILFARFEVFAVKGRNENKAKGFGGENRVVHTTHSAGWDAKNRYGLPDVMPLDMELIMDAIRAGNGAGGMTADELTAEIRRLAEALPEEKKALVEGAIDKANGNPATLGTVLNKTRVTLAQLEN